MGVRCGHQTELIAATAGRRGDGGVERVQLASRRRGRTTGGAAGRTSTTGARCGHRRRFRQPRRPSPTCRAAGRNNRTDESATESRDRCVQKGVPRNLPAADQRVGSDAHHAAHQTATDTDYQGGHNSAGGRTGSAGESLKQSARTWRGVYTECRTGETCYAAEQRLFADTAEVDFVPAVIDVFLRHLRGEIDTTTEDRAYPGDFHEGSRQPGNPRHRDESPLGRGFGPYSFHPGQQPVPGSHYYSFAASPVRCRFERAADEDVRRHHRHHRDEGPDYSPFRVLIISAGGRRERGQILPVIMRIADIRQHRAIPEITFLGFGHARQGQTFHRGEAVQTGPQVLPAFHAIGYALRRRVSDIFVELGKTLAGDPFDRPVRKFGR